ncbi:MAG TPA: S9 family peptidase [Gammaproteobacteria bacterium]|jgi:dipeptidyl aminopeptidase/acylaminoacyl peptidase|nr:S9 family peptidase [Gammaproteobacteria bacterium]
MKSHVLLAGIVFPLLSCSLYAADTQSAAGFQLDDLQKLASIGNPQLAPDGKQIAVIVSRPDWKDDKNKSEIELVDVASGTARAVTYDREGLDSPRWSPDGTHLAFLAKDTDTKQAQIFVMSMAGGDPVRVTDNKQGVDEFTWSPDGKQIAFVAQDPPINEKAVKAHDDVFHVTDGNFQLRAAVAPWHLWIVASTGGAEKQLTHGDFSLQTDQQGATPLVWSHDGKHIVFTKFPNPYWGPSFHSVIAEVDVAGGGPRTLVPAQTSAGFAYAPDDDTFAFLRPRDGDQNNGNAVYVHVDGKTRDATAAQARNFDTFAWLPKDGGLLLTGEDGTRSVIWQQGLHGPARALDTGEVNIGSDTSVSRNGVIAFTGSTATHPDELYVMDSVTAKPRRLTDLNAFVDKLKLGRTETLNWQGPDGFGEDGVLTYPVGYQQGHKYPLVLVIHGGPEGASTVRFSPLPQLLAAAGFLVFQPNYRGSINLGDKYQHAIYRDTGAGPGKDVMAGLAAVEKLGIVDAKRIGVSGWSYGGYMTTWLTGHYPKIWQAAVSGAALTDWVMDYTVAYYQTGDLYFFGGSPWTAKYWDIWREQSPISAARNVKAPTLIMGDVGDPNVPLVNSYEWYHALRDNGVEVQFYAYPADTHFPHDIVRTTDVYRRWVGWMKQHLG